MSSPAWELQKSIYAALINASDVTTAIGGARIFDSVPRDAKLPYVTFGAKSSRDWSTDTDEGQEHAITLHVWSDAGGEREAQLIMEAVRSALHDAPLAITGHRLVSLFHVSSDVQRLGDGKTIFGAVRFRAITEQTS